MPEITKIHKIDITPERFLEACSPTELYELNLLLQSERYQQQIQEHESGEKAINYLKEKFNGSIRQDRVKNQNGHID